jgi:hypothetical protein
MRKKYSRLERVIFIMHSNAHVIRVIQLYTEGDRPTAHLAIFYILLARILTINQHLKHLTAVGAAHHFLFQYVHSSSFKAATKDGRLFISLFQKGH